MASIRLRPDMPRSLPDDDRRMSIVVWAFTAGIAAALVLVEFFPWTIDVIEFIGG